MRPVRIDRLVFIVVLAVACATTCAPSAQADEYQPLFEKAAKMYPRLDANLLRAISYGESHTENSHPLGGSYCNSAGYCGLMQVNDVDGTYQNNPWGNLRWGARMFDSCMRGTGDNVIEALVCYNAGIGRVQQMHAGTLNYWVARFNLPRYGSQVGRVPAWSDTPGDSTNYVMGYVNSVLTKYKELGAFQPGQNTVPNDPEPEKVKSRPATRKSNGGRVDVPAPEPVTVMPPVVVQPLPVVVPINPEPIIPPIITPPAPTPVPVVPVDDLMLITYSPPNESAGYSTYFPVLIAALGLWLLLVCIRRLGRR